MEHWTWIDWYILGHKEHPLATLRRVAVRAALPFIVGFVIGRYAR